MLASLLLLHDHVINHVLVLRAMWMVMSLLGVDHQMTVMVMMSVRIQLVVMMINERYVMLVVRLGLMLINLHTMIDVAVSINYLIFIGQLDVSMMINVRCSGLSCSKVSSLTASISNAAMNFLVKIIALIMAKLLLFTLDGAITFIIDIHVYLHSEVTILFFIGFNQRLVVGIRSISSSSVTTAISLLARLTTILGALLLGGCGLLAL